MTRANAQRMVHQGTKAGCESGPYMKQKADKLALKIGKDVYATDGWFHGQKKSENKVYCGPHGESMILIILHCGLRRCGQSLPTSMHRKIFFITTNLVFIETNRCK